MTFLSESVVEDAASVLGRLPIGFQFDSNSAPILGFDRCARKRRSCHHLGRHGPTSSAPAPSGRDRAIYRATVARSYDQREANGCGRVRSRASGKAVGYRAVDESACHDSACGENSANSATSFPNLQVRIPNLAQSPRGGPNEFQFVSNSSPIRGFTLKQRRCNRRGARNRQSWRKADPKLVSDVTRENCAICHFEAKLVRARMYDGFERVHSE